METRRGARPLDTHVQALRIRAHGAPGPYGHMPFGVSSSSKSRIRKPE